ncbi:MAG: class I SAM-dependent methyltransferase, partial [Bacteroidales bacterium]|nr:class I SAM-dependent methyltransferase [Bacteroidales bacterium]
MMMKKESEFDGKAADWDKNPMHWDRSVAITDQIKQLIPLNSQMTALEFGAGTGIASFLLKDHLKEITLMDSSSEMVKVMDQKIRASGVKNLKTLNCDLEQQEYKDEMFDLIFTQMVLHHVGDIRNIIIKFHDLLNPGGYLAIADLYPEDGS